MTSIATIFPTPEVAPDNLVTTFFVGNPVVRDHTGLGLAKSVASTIEKVVITTNMPSQIVSAGTDGQYFKLGVLKHLKEIIGLRKCFFTWDPAHRLMLARGEVRGAKVGDNQKDQFTRLSKLLGMMEAFLKYVKYGKKFKNLLEVSEKYPDEKFYKLNSISTTRFISYIHRVFSAFLKDAKFIIESLRERSEVNDDNAKSLLRQIGNTTFFAFLAGLTDIYDVIAKLCGYVQKVNLFIWQRMDMVRKSLSSMKKMEDELRDDRSLENWPNVKIHWPKLKEGTFINFPKDTIDHLFARSLRSQTNSSNYQSVQDEFSPIRRELIDILVTLQTRIEIRLLKDLDEEILCEHSSRLTDVLKYKTLAKKVGPAPISLRVLENNDLIESCRYVTCIDEVSDEFLRKQILLFLERLHPLLLKKNISSRDILHKFLIKEELFSSIPDLMQCIVCCYFIGHNESYVESIGSKLKVHNPPNRNVTLSHLEEEVIISWNGPAIQHSDHLVKETLNHMYGDDNWHFYRQAHKNLKFFNVSKAVDSLQNQSSSYRLDRC